ncbi:DDE-TNP-IS1595 domain-containing protein [Vairimorpha necatrix]|uniref:DDE-TNP-IS1595 domain-containing protein n=1 Tax=Vairimorpha necatrix TaxID=6039 RepID=A0AAX4JB20_9MICR
MEVKNLYSRIFVNEVAAIEYLEALNFYRHTIKCDCGLVMDKVKSKNYLEGICFYCTNGCKKRKGIKNGTFLQSSRMPTHIQLRMLYCWAMKMTNPVVSTTCEISEFIYICFKGRILEKVKNEINTSFEKIGGVGRTIQVDEVAIRSGNIITNPSIKEHNSLGITWLVCGVESEENNYFLKIIPNRTAAVIQEIFRKCVVKGTTIRTNDSDLYSSAVHDFGSPHEVVDHSVNLTNVLGQSSIKIKNLWSRLKAELRKIKEIEHVNMEDFTGEFRFRSKHRQTKKIDTYAEIFKQILLIE